MPKTTHSPGFQLSRETIDLFLTCALNPQEIAGKPAIQHARVKQVLQWFEGLAKDQVDPAWLAHYAYELAYYTATNGAQRCIDVDAERRNALVHGMALRDREPKVLSVLRQADAAQVDPATFLKAACEVLVERAKELGYVITISDVSDRPLAMGNTHSEIDVRVSHAVYRGETT